MGSLLVDNELVVVFGVCELRLLEQLIKWMLMKQMMMLRRTLPQLGNQRIILEMLIPTRLRERGNCL